MDLAPEDHAGSSLCHPREKSVATRAIFANCCRWAISLTLAPLLSQFASMARCEPSPSTIRLLNLSGSKIAPLDGAKGHTTVFIFTRTDCPISNRYAPVINKLDKEFTPKGVVFWLVYVDPHQSAVEIRQHDKEYGYHLRVALDPDHKLVKLAEARVTPEAAVFSPHGQLLYHGRIDNSYVDIGKRLPSPTRNDLSLTLDAITTGQPIPNKTAPAVGCYISDLER
jgi:hypothetical protein